MIESKLVDQIPNILKNSLSFGLDVFQEKLGMMNNSKHFEELFFVKYGFRKSSSKDSKNTGGGCGGGLAHFNFFQTEGKFFRRWLPRLQAQTLPDANLLTGKLHLLQ